MENEQITRAKALQAINDNVSERATSVIVERLIGKLIHHPTEFLIGTLERLERNELRQVLISHNIRHGVCAECDTIILARYNVDGVGQVCNECFNAKYSDFVQCDDCGFYFNENDEMQHVSDSNRDDSRVCDGCYDDYFYCDGCGYTIHRDEQSEDSQLCDECYHNRDDDSMPHPMHDWNYVPEYRYMGLNARKYGIELEVKSANDSELISDIHEDSDNLLYCKYDSSICGGAEIVSHPCDYNYHTKHMEWDKLMQKLINFGCTSHDAKTCGLHIHVNRDSFGASEHVQDFQIAKVLYIVNVFSGEMQRFARRSDYRWNDWCGNVSANFTKTETSETLIDKKRYADRNGARYSMVNLQNCRTIEFRIFRGTLKYSTFLASLQFTRLICEVAENISVNDLNALTWDTLKERATDIELINYIESRGL
jgi:hypothetical protein